MFKRQKLKNGLTIITAPIKDSPSVTVLVMVKAGSKYESKEISGLSHFLEHMCFKGTEKRPRTIDIAKEIDSLGAQNNAFTYNEFTGYYAKVHHKHFSKILDIVSDIYLNPVFDEKEIEKEKGVIIEEINMYEDMPMHQVARLFMETVYGDQPAGWDIAGTKETVKSFNRNHFINYRKKHYVASATTVIVSGNINEKEVVNEIKNKFQTIHNGNKSGKKKVIDKQTKPVLGIKDKDTDQTHMILGLRTFKVSDDKNYALEVLNSILGTGMSSRLFQKLRDEMGVGYYVSSRVDSFTDHGYLAVFTGVDKSRVEEVIIAILGELKKLRDELVTEEEIKKAKEYLIGNMYLGLESSDSVAEFYAIQDAINDKILNPAEYAKKIQKVTAKDIQKVAKEIIKDNRLNLAIVGNIKDKESIEKILHL